MEEERERRRKEREEGRKRFEAERKKRAAEEDRRRKEEEVRAAGVYAGLILGLRPANERRRYFVTTSLIGWTQA